MFKVDLSVSRNRPFDRQQLNRRQNQLLKLPDHTAFPVSPEYLILAKLDWFRLGAEVSERQWQDVQGVFGVQGERLDRNYVRQWAAVLDVADLLHRATADHEARQPRNE